MDKSIDKILKEFVEKANEFIASDETILYGSYETGFINHIKSYGKKLCLRF